VPLRPLPRAIALWSYVAKSSTEMSFEKDEIITVEAQIPGEWWRGRIDPNKKGHFPKNYVQLLPSSDSYADGHPQQQLGAEDVAALMRLLQQQVVDLTKKVEEEAKERADKFEKDLAEMTQKYEAEVEARKRMQAEVEELRRAVAPFVSTSSEEVSIGGGGRLEKLEKEVLRLEEQAKTETRVRMDLEAMHNRIDREVESLGREVQKIKRTLEDEAKNPNYAQALKKTGRDLSV